MRQFRILSILLLIVSLFPYVASAKNNILDSVKELKSINAKLVSVDNEEGINSQLENKDALLDKLTAQLKIAKSTQLPAIVLGKELVFLESRIQINTEKGNTLAAQRDQIRLEEYKVNLAIRRYLEYLITSTKNYQSIDSIVDKSQQLLAASREKGSQTILPIIEIENNVAEVLKKNYQSFLLANNSYQDVLAYVISHPRKIASVHWFQEFSLIAAISYVNHFDFIQPINYRLAPFQVDAGGITLSFIIFFLIYFSYPFVFRCTTWCVENHIIDKEVEHQELIYHEVRRPLRALLIFFAINLGAHAFFYKTDFRESLEGFSFVIYSLIFNWLFFKIIDSLVLVQVEKLSVSNKVLRKELFNLAVQSGKCLTIIVTLAFGLNHFGISLTAIMSTLGVGGLAFALAAKDTLSNLFGGMTILFDNVFGMGDWVKVGDVEGTVAEIGLRSTTIRTFDNALITIPNSLVSISSVMNWNRRSVGRRIKMHVGVTYESNMSDLRQCLEDIRIMLQNHPSIANPKQKHSNKRKGFKFSSLEDTHGIKSTQLVFLDRYSDFSIDILIYCFSRTVNWAEWLEVKEDVLFKIAEILEKNNLEFAYPTQVGILRQDANQEFKLPPMLE